MHPLRPGDPERLGAHTLSGRLDEGPRGVAYLGKESEDGPTRVIKLLPAVPGAGPQDAERYKGVQRISSVYVARTLDAGMHDEQPYIVREHIEGRSLAEAVAADGPLDGDTLERVAVGVLTALTAVHLAGVTHRGLTPHNVLLAADGPRVTDIDLGEAAGELGYRSPEQLSGLGYGPYADVFAWAATIVFAATGQPPFGHDAQAVLNGEPEVGALAEPLRRVVLSALSKDVAQRPTTYTALLQLLGDKSGAAAPRVGVVATVPPPPQAPEGELFPPQTIQLPPLEAPTEHQALAEHQAPLEGVPVPQQTWGPPPVPQQGPWEGAPGGQQPPSQVWQAPTQHGGGAAPRRKSFPIGLAAAVTAVALLSGVGLWGAGHYAKLEPVSNSAAEAKKGGTLAIGGGGGDSSTQGQGQPQQQLPGQPNPQQSQPDVTVPWASASPDPTDVAPLVLPTDYPSSAPTAPEFSTVPTPQPILTQPVTQPTVTQPAAQPTATQPTATPSERKNRKHRPTPTPTESKDPTPTQEPTKSKDPDPTPTQEPTKTREPEPTPTKTTEEPRPTPTKTTQSPKPTPTKTTAKPTPTPTKTTAKPTPTKTTAKPTPTPPKTNPYTPAQVCGGGFSVQRSGAFSGGVTYQLYNSGTGENCVVTMKTANVGQKTPVSATLDVQGGGSRTDSGSYEYYAGPVKLPAKGKCVKFSGSAGSGSTNAGYSNCG
ncbi:serine/threonine protein kinase [Nonomuraea guangzhouensis]|uniref:non-specific serine/threonine protein kinase n=1 Tax=Nonomuraea guangzhouensis TaxID=1291555 RepID=A0ABW4GI59_9ACTN|nr:serine/threonine-protein kinase [Nonomuraea guangzhouensis]